MMIANSETSLNYMSQLLFNPIYPFKIKLSCLFKKKRQFGPGFSEIIIFKSMVFKLGHGFEEVFPAPKTSSPP